MVSMPLRPVPRAGMRSEEDIEVGFIMLMVFIVVSQSV
jgi:hypothetical protein